MKRLFLYAALLVLGLPDSAFAQASRPYLTRSVEDLGTFRVATKSWIPRESSFLGVTTSQSIYDNTCVPQTIGGLQQINTIVQVDNTEILADTGQIPSTSNTVLVGTGDAYTVQGWRWAVCPGEPAAAGLSMMATIFFLESLASCSGGGNPAATAPVLSSIEVTDIPTSSSGTCFIFDLDLTGTVLEFVIQGDGDGTYHGSSAGDALDTFGIAMTMVRSDGGPFQGTNSFGLAGDPGTNANSFGCQDALGDPGPGGFIGDSTIFQNPGRHVDGSTGFGTDDFLETVLGVGPGCFFIAGGYDQSTPGLPAPWASLHCEIYGVAVGAPPAFVDYCNGDGGDQMGCSDCPCSNNAVPGTIGGCINSASTSSRLLASGSSSVGAGDLRLEMTGAPATAFSILFSGGALAPTAMANPCTGLGSGVQSMFFDGLRCVVQSTLRHGGRSVAANGTIGMISPGWGPPDGPAPMGGGIPGQGGFVAGQTRYFQVFHRDDPLASCMRGMNTSQAISVLFTL